MIVAVVTLGQLTVFKIYSRIYICDAITADTIGVSRQAGWAGLHRPVGSPAVCIHAHRHCLGIFWILRLCLRNWLDVVLLCVRHRHILRSSYGNGGPARL